MQFNGLCIVLPPNSGEMKQPEMCFQQAFQPAKEQAKAKQPQRACGGQVLALIHDSLSKLYNSGWWRICQHGGVDKEKKSSSSTVFHDMDGVQVAVKIGRDNPRIFSYAELFIGSNGFSQDQVLGSGGFGKVYKAVLPSDGTVVAVKCYLSEKGKQFEKSFAAELTAVADLRHKNLVRLRGWCVHEDQLHLVYDYMPNRSLDRILFRRPENLKAEPLGWGQRGKIVKGLAAALYYLHEQLETQIIHRDVKTSNVMLDSHYNARLGDFGMARWLEHEIEYAYKYNNRKTSSRIDHFRLGETSRIGGTIGYLPPESLQKSSNATSKSDVFSFGIVVLEVVSGRRAIDLTYPDDQIILLDWIRRLSDEGKLQEAADTRLPDGSYNLSEMQHLIHIGLLCSLQDPQLRPSMKWVVEALSDICFKLPALPSFLSHPLYISISSPSETSPSSTSGTSSVTENASIITNYTSSNYVTAAGETVYLTADHKNSEIISSRSMHHQPPFPVVETPREISFKEIVSATDNFSESRRVAELDFGTAYHGILDDNCHVLVKRLGMKTCPALRDRFSNELRNLGRLRHRNLVQLRGWCTEQGEMLVVYDYSASRILSQLLLHHNKGRTGYSHSVLQWHHRYNIVKALASAVLYLHEEWDEQVIHRNITSSAVILEPDMNPRLSCFALAEFLSRNEHGHHAVNDTSKSARGIFGYMSPEYVESGEATSAADVYSFGVVVLEVVSGQMAVDFRQQEVLLVKKVHEFEMRKRPLKELADIRLNGEYNGKELMRLVRLGIACTRCNPQLRPSMRQIVSILDGNDKLLNQKNKESREEWRQRNDSSLSMIRRIQALGIQ